MGEELSGQWKANTISVSGDSVQHQLSNKIELDLNYPEYKFSNGQVSEEGSYYIKDQFLNLEKGTDTVKNVRKIEILKFSNDSLELLLIDPASQRKVLFIR